MAREPWSDPEAESAVEEIDFESAEEEDLDADEVNDEDGDVVDFQISEGAEDSADVDVQNEP